MNRKITISIFDPNCLRVVNGARLQPKNWGGDLLKIFDNVSLSSFSKRLNGDFSNANVRLTVSPNDYGKGKAIDCDNLVIVKLAESSASQSFSKDIYVGKISRVRSIQTNKDTILVDLELQGMLSQLQKTLCSVPISGFNYSQSGQVWALIEHILSRTNQSYIFTDDSIEKIITPSFSFSFNNTTAYEALESVMGLYPRNVDGPVYFFVKADFLFYLRQIFDDKNDIKHFFQLGRNVAQIEHVIDSSDFVSDLYAWNGQAGGSLRRGRVGFTSSSFYKLRSQIPRTFNSGTNLSMLERQAKRYFDTYSKFVDSARVTIPHSLNPDFGYNIYDIEVGDIFTVLNSNLETKSRIVNEIFYNFDNCVLVSEEYEAFTSRLLFEQNKELKTVKYKESPATYPNF